MARYIPLAKSEKQLPPPGDGKVSAMAEAVPGGSSVSPVAIIQEQLAARLAGEETRWAPRTAFWVSVGATCAIWLAIAAALRASV